MTEESSMQRLRQTSPLAGGSADYVEDLYEQYLEDPSQVEVSWQTYFQQLDEAAGGFDDVSHATIRQQLLMLAEHPHLLTKTQSGDLTSVEQERKQAQLWRLITAFRRVGHQHAQLDPLNLSERLAVPYLEPSYYGLVDADLDKLFDTGDFQGMGQRATLRDILEKLRLTYCGTLGIEYMHITDHDEIVWLQSRLEPTCAKPRFSADEKREILMQLVAAEGLEKYLATKYVGQKRFGLEGAECFIPALHELVMRAGSKGLKDIVLGMAHRGRLNVLVNILGKSPAELFDEFEGKSKVDGTGDVKYHQGFSSGVDTPGGSLHLALAFNPSHLEIIDPVVQGSVRARQERRGDVQQGQVLPVLIHGDAAFAGQGVVMETFALSQARGYRTGGTVHFVVNNQIGFTTSNPLDSRSSLYCTDIAKMVQAPILHVNGDSPESVVYATQLAFDYRMQFKKDIVVDVVCYRRHGHNEADEPSITQPLMYQAIKKHYSPARIYADKLLDEQIIEQDFLKQATADYRQKLDKGESVIPMTPVTPGGHSDKYAVDWTPFLGRDVAEVVQTSVTTTKLKQLTKQLQQLPDDFKLQPQVAREMQTRGKMLDGELPMNWGCAETLAYASLVTEGYGVRLSGQDSGRGTFSHRHAILHDQQTGSEYIALQHLASHQAKFKVINSVLSEVAVLGFEYGFATADPNTLVLWEAQFGDFANGAQVVVDQFISSGEQKWGRLCGLVLLLPHGYEGQGPEHSSARLERYLQLCAQHNMQVCVPSNPAQMFHLLRRQMLRPARKPLIVLTPKSLLRHKLATSTLQELTEGGFQCVIPETEAFNIAEVTRVVLCSGKVYYDLFSEREKAKQRNVAIVRVEQLYPFPQEELTALLASYPQAKQVIWCQEEPMNQGAWYSITHRLLQCLANEQSLSYAGRQHFASTAVGVAKLHHEQQMRLINEALLGTRK